MSDREWYEGLTAADFSGKHLQVRMINGVIYTGPVLADDCLVAMNLCGESRSILERTSAAFKWRKSHSLVSVSLVWDERDWEQVPIDDAEEGDVLVIGGSKEDIFEVHGKQSADRWWTINNDENSCITPDMISCALRKKPKLPTEPGFYRGADGTLLIRLDCSRGNWMFVSVGFSVSGAYVNDEVAEKHLPLTPVHFVDGRAE